MGQQVGFEEIEGVSEAFERSIGEALAKWVVRQVGGTDPLYNQDAIDAREQSSTFDGDDVRLEVQVIDMANDQVYYFWMVPDPDAPNDPNQYAYWFDFDADWIPDTFVEVAPNGTYYWDSNGNGHGSAVWHNAFAADWPG